MRLKSKTAITVLGVLVVIVAVYRLSTKTYGVEKSVALNIEVSEQGKQVRFPNNYPGLSQFKLEAVKLSSSELAVTAPAQIMAAINSHGVLFADPDLTELYSQYVQAKSNLERSLVNRERIQQLYDNQAATALELNNAKNDLATAQAVNAEYETKLRVAGFDPKALSKTSKGNVWLFADVAENQLHEVEPGEEVRTEFLSFPGQTFLGKAAAISDVIDPETRTIKVRVVLDNSKQLLKPGMFATCDFGNLKQSVIVLPTTSIVTVQEQNYVFVGKPNRVFERRAVSIGSSDPLQSVISKGLEPGEKVATTGAILLKGLSFGY